ncbi:MAG: hypothetical protein Q4D38_01090 [Planctomycetia bacterium]|nr:hypothetical protein [Planctomycetia bacterium]
MRSIKKSLIRFWGFLALSFSCLIFVFGVANAEEQKPEDPDFRRVYIPQSMVNELPTRGVPYWVIQGDDFEEWAKSRRGDDASAATMDSRVIIQKAHYSATLRDNRFLEGSASLQMSLVSEPNPKDEELEWRFPPVSFALDRDFGFRVLDSNTEAQAREARFFLNKMGEVVFYPADFSQTKILETQCRWSQRNKQPSNGDLCFNLELFPATDIIVDLVLPKVWVPQSDVGMLQELPNASDELLRHWRFYLGGNRRATLRLKQNDAPKPVASPISVAQKNVFSFNKEGLDIACRFDIDTLLEEQQTTFAPVVRLRLQMGGSFVLTSVLYNGKSIPWSVAGGEQDETKNGVKNGTNDENQTFDQHGTEVVVDLPEELCGVGNTLEVYGIQNLEPFYTDANPAALVKIPAIRLLDALWSEGETTLLVEEPLEIADVILSDARIVENEKLWDEKTTLRRTKIVVREIAPNASIKTAFMKKETRQHIDMSTALDIQESEIAAIVEMRVSASNGECFEIWGIVDRAWTIDSVETPSSGIIDDWNLDSVPNFLSKLDSADESKLRPIFERLSPNGWDIASLSVLRIQLAHSIRPRHSVSFRIKARRLELPHNYVFRSIDLAPVFFPAYELGESWTLCGTSYPWNIQFAESYRAQTHPLSTAVAAPAAIPAFASAATPTAVPTTAPFSVAPLAATPAAPSAVSSLSAVPGSSESTVLTPEKGKEATSISSASSTLAALRRQFPERRVFLATKQDFKNAPMLFLERKQKTYTARIEGFYDLSRTPHAIFRIVCDPKGGEIDRLRVLIRPGTLFGVTWNFPRELSGSSAICIERKSYGASHQVSIPVESKGAESKDADLWEAELWEVTLRQPQQTPFEIELALATEKKQGTKIEEGTKNVSPWTQEELAHFLLENFPGGILLPLVDVPEAQSQVGLVTLQSDVSRSVFIDTHEMEPVLVDPTIEVARARNSGTSDVQTFRYNPRHISNSMAPFVRIRLQGALASERRAWIWKQACQTQFFADGRTLHIAAFRLENVGEDSFRVEICASLGEKITLLGAIVNGQRVVNPTIETENLADGNVALRVKLPLPVWRRQSEVVLQWVEEGTPLRVYSQLCPPNIKTDWLVLQTRWQAWAPENYIPLHHGCFCEESRSSEEGREMISAYYRPLDGRVDESQEELDENRVSVVQESIFTARDSVLLRIFGKFRFGRNMFFHSSRSLPANGLAFVQTDASRSSPLLLSGGDGDNLALAAIFYDTLEPKRLAGWNLCTQNELVPLRVIQANALEATRWFFLLLTFVVTARWFQSFRPIRVGICGLSATACLLAPLVWSPIFSGIFLGLLLSFALHSIIRHREFIQQNVSTIIRISGGASKSKLRKDT